MQILVLAPIIAFCIITAIVFAADRMKNKK